MSPAPSTKSFALAELIVLLLASAIYLPGLISPPALMDDVDAAESMQAKNMLLSGNWITQHLNGTAYLDKAPLKYWLTASLFKLFGIHDWVARLPTALAAILLCWLVVRMGRWADSPATGLYSGVVISTSIGMFLFTRTVIPDIILTLFITLCFWCLIRALESQKPSRLWALGIYASMALAVLTKGLIGAVFPIAIIILYLLITRQISAWRRLFPLSGCLLFLAIAAPWHILATIQNPPILDFTLHAGPHFGGKFRGFFWFYFVNEQLLRFLNERWPRDYNTVPRLWFWLYHILWFFPWSFFLVGVTKLQFRPVDSASRLRILAACWISVIMLFFTFSTTQEYYSMPVYPAVALLLGSVLNQTQERWTRLWSRCTGMVCLIAAAVMGGILVMVWHRPTPGDIFVALSQHPALYTLSLGHMADLTLPAFAYLRLPLLVAAIAMCAGGLALLLARAEHAYLLAALTMVGFFQASRLALVVFDPYLSSYAVAQKLNQLPYGTVVVCGKYNPLSSVFYYSTDKAIQNEDDLDILEYGSIAPGAPKITISDKDLIDLWHGTQTVYLVAKAPKLPKVQRLIGSNYQQLIFHSGDKYLFSNHQMP